ncbi:MAG: hypothetical protein AB8B51_19615 [Sedimentitalea sp.]
MLDQFGTEITTSQPRSLTAWNDAMSSYLAFRGDPVARLSGLDDPGFIEAPAFCAAMKLLSGLDPDSDSVMQDRLALMEAAKGASGAQMGHADAVELLAEGAFSQAAAMWDGVLAQAPGDVLALKCSHETWFLVGAAEEMRGSTTAALDRLDIDHPVYAVAAAQHGFALEETGDYAAAESWGRLALDLAPRDCWALHCLAHVYETQNRHADAMALLNAKKPIWREQNLLNAHIWWHLALRLIEAGATEAALAIFDEELAEVDADNRFRLTDGTSLLWRLELEGVDVGARWRGMADKWAQSAELHTNGFLDVHAALAFARCPDQPAADLFFDTLAKAFAKDTSENAQTYRTLIQPISRALRLYPDNPQAACAMMAPLLAELHRMGGSIVQREIVERSYSSALIATGAVAQCAAWIDPQIGHHPNTPWLLRDRARCADAGGDTAKATLLRRRADLMFAGFQ